MGRATFRQADVERIIRAAENQGASVQIDLRSLTLTVIPGIHSQSQLDGSPKPAGILPLGNLAPDGKENWDET